MTYLSALHSGMLSVGVTETDGQCVSVRWTQTDATKEQRKEKTKSYQVNGWVKNKQDNK